MDEARVERELSASRHALIQALDAPAEALSYPFGAFGARECLLARRHGYSLAFTLARGWRGDPLAIPRHPVYLWAPPRPGTGALAALERLGAAGANRCAAGTTLWQRWTGAQL
jgi:hypothetical protein